MTEPISMPRTSPSIKAQSQPVHFSFGEDLRLMDANGVEMWGRIVYIVGRSALVEYRAIEP